MKRRCFMTFLLGFVACEPLAFGQDPTAYEKRSIRIRHSGSVANQNIHKGELCVLDGDFMIVAFGDNGTIPGAPSDAPLPDYSLHFRVLQGTLRVKMAPRNIVIDRQGKFSQKLLTKDGWYITADFATDPPRVVLTEKPTEHSQWSLVLTPKDTPFASRWFIKNEGAPGKAVWLSMEKDGKTYRGGVVRKPILSAEKKDYFWIGDADSGK